MNRLNKVLLILAACLIPAAAQTITPNTTLCGAVTAISTNVCLTSTTGVVNQTGIYVDNEYMLVVLSSNQTLASSNAYVPVSRSNRVGIGGPAAHNNAAIAWLSLTPGQTKVPGTNGFNMNPNTSLVGPCTSGSYTYLPIIMPSTNVPTKRTCSTSGFWVPYVTAGDPVNGGVQVLTTNGALAVAGGTYVITKAGVLADTLAAPTAGIQDGMIIMLSSTTANAHTLTATGLLQTGTASVNVATFAAQAGAGLTLMSYGGKWIVLASVGITFS